MNLSREVSVVVCATLFLGVLGVGGRLIVDHEVPNQERISYVTIQGATMDLIPRHIEFDNGYYEVVHSLVSPDQFYPTVITANDSTEYNVIEPEDRQLDLLNFIVSPILVALLLIFDVKLRLRMKDIKELKERLTSKSNELKQKRDQAAQKRHFWVWRTLLKSRSMRRHNAAKTIQQQWMRQKARQMVAKYFLIAANLKNINSKVITKEKKILEASVIEKTKSLTLQQCRSIVYQFSRKINIISSQKCSRHGFKLFFKKIRSLIQRRKNK